MACHFVASMSLQLWGLFLAEDDWGLRNTVLASCGQQVLHKLLQLLALLCFSLPPLPSNCPALACFNGLQAIQQALQSAQQDNVRANARKLMIERRKEEAERRLMQAEEEAERSRMMQLKATEQAEEERRRKDMCVQCSAWVFAPFDN